MKRNPEDFTTREFDVLIIGGGMFGACAAWCAVLRGYSVALIEKADFAHATSSNHYKFIHGGIRYLQHADVVRLRESAREKSALVRIAPHLAYPMPVALPTYGHGKKGKAILGAGMLAYDTLTFDRNRGILDPARKTPMGSFLNRRELLSLFPGVPSDGLTGAAVFHDGQMYNPARLVLSFLKSAASRGAVVANYVEARRFVNSNDRVTGCTVRDGLTGREFDVRARVTVNAAGPWAAQLLLDGMQLELKPKPSFSRDLAFVVDKSICPTHALGCQARTHDSDALLDRGGRHLFLVPWRGKTLVGVWHRYTRARPDRLSVSREELDNFLTEINAAYAGLDLVPEDLRIVNTGLILFGAAEDQASASDHSFAHRSILVDHADQGLEGLVTVIGARATVARGIGEETMEIVGRKLSRPGGGGKSQWHAIHGGNFERFDAVVSNVRARMPDVGPAAATAVAHNYGTAHVDLATCAPDGTYLTPIGETNVLKAEILHAVRHEMALSLSDIVMRRTEMGTAGDPGNEALALAADLAAGELGWDRERRETELGSVRRMLQGHGPWTFVAREADMPAGE